MPKKADDYLKKPYARILIPNEGGTVSAEILEFTGCFAQGDSAQEAIKNLNKAASEWIDACLRQGRSIPEPTATQGYSGTVSLRIPKGLHRQASRMAERDGVSLNQYLMSAIAARVGADDLFNRLAVQASTYIVNLYAKVDIHQRFEMNTTFSPSTLPPQFTFAATTTADSPAEIEKAYA